MTNFHRTALAEGRRPQPLDHAMGSLAELDPARRAFLKTSALVGGSLVLGFTLPVRAARLMGPAAPLPSESEFAVTAWVRITPDNQVKLIVSQAEIGQGISTTLPAIL